METPKRYRLWLVGAALGILIALLLAPDTRWLVRAHLALALPRKTTLIPLRYLFAKTSDADNAYIEGLLDRTAARHPDDLSIQMAAIVMTPIREQPPSQLSDSVDSGSGSTDVVSRLRALETRFPASPFLRAAVLRFATKRAVHIWEEEAAKAPGEAHTPSGKPRDPMADTPEQLAAFDADAAEGEQLDPANAYFPLMRAAGLFAARRDEDAIAALKRAAEKPRWEEYISDEEQGRWRLQEEAFGDYGVLPRIASYAAILFPHYALIRATARMALYKAIEAEKAGHAEEGLALRNAVLQCGSLMRVQSHIIIGSLVGIAIEAIATARPGGASPPKWKSSETAEQRLAQRLSDYDTWLRRIGHPEESARVHAETEAGVQVRQIGMAAGNSKNYLFGAPLVRLAGWWIGALLTLSNALWMLALGGTAALFGRNKRLRAGQPVSRCARWSAVLGLAAGGILAIGLLFSFPVTAWPNFCLAALALGICAMALSGSQWRERIYGLGIFALSGLGAILVIRICTWQAEGAPIFLSFLRMLFNLSEGQATQPSLTWVSGLALVIPMLTALVLGILSRIYRVPLTAGLVRGLRGVALPLACSLFLVYTGIVIVIVRQEAAVQEALDRQGQHEGRYMAAIVGREWPRETH